MANGRPEIIKTFKNYQNFVKSVSADAGQNKAYTAKLVKVGDSFKNIIEKIAGYDKFIAGAESMDQKKLLDYQTDIMMAYLDLYCDIDEYKKEIENKPDVSIADYEEELNIVQDAIYGDLRTFQFFRPEPGKKFEQSFKDAEMTLAENPVRFGTASDKVTELVNIRKQSRENERKAEFHQPQNQFVINNYQQAPQNNYQQGFQNNNQQIFRNNNQQVPQNNFRQVPQNNIGNNNPMPNLVYPRQQNRNYGLSFNDEQKLKKNVRLLQIWTNSNLIDILYNKIKDDPTADPVGLKNVEKDMGELFKMIYPFQPKRNEQPLIPNVNDLQNIKKKISDVYKNMETWTANYIKNSANPDEQNVSIAANIMEKLNDDKHVIKHTNAGLETLSASTGRNARLKEKYGLTFDKKHAFPCKPGKYMEMMNKIRVQR